MMFYEFILDSGKGAVYIEYEAKNISINYRYEAYTDDFNWGGHYRCEIENGVITEEFLNIGTEYLEVKITIESALKSISNDEIADLIRKSYLNKKIAITRF